MAIRINLRKDITNKLKDKEIRVDSFLDKKLRNMGRNKDPEKIIEELRNNKKLRRGLERDDVEYFEKHL